MSTLTSMNVLLVAPQPFYRERGTPIAVRMLVETLCEFGHRVDLLVYHDGVDVTIPGMRLIRAGRPPGIGQVPIGISWQKLVCDVFLIWRMVALVRRNRYDVVHAVEEAMFPAAVMSLAGPRKLVYDMDSSLSDQLTDKWSILRPARRLLEGIERVAVRRATMVLAVCEDLAAKVRPWIGEDRVIVLPDVPLEGGGEMLDVESLRAIAGADSLIGLYVGNLERYQGIDLLLAGLQKLPRSLKLRTIVIGGSPEHVATYRTRASELGLDDRLHFLGSRPVNNLGAYLGQADILISPRTLGQNTPMKVYSYMQAGKAILATDIRSHTQALDASCAELVAPNAAALAEGLERLVSNAGRRQALGMAARQKAEREYSLSVFKAKLQLAYERVART